MDYHVIVQNHNGDPLDPTTRCGHVRKLLDQGKARVVRTKPFTIRLQYGIDKEFVHGLYGSTDPGRTNIGDAVVTEECEVRYLDHVTTNNKDVPEHMGDRRTHRQASRRGERQRRKRRAEKHGTTSTKLGEGRMIAGCDKPVMMKTIINTESKFQNRNCPNGWVTPTVEHLIRTHLNHVDQICQMYPIHGWCIEINKFAFMRMEDDTVRGVDFQNGRLKTYESVNDYVWHIQNGKCAACGAPIDDVHHIRPRSKGGSDGPDNRIGLCNECHHKVHTGELDINKIGKKQKYAALSVLNQAIPYIYQGLVDRFGEENVYFCFGSQTENMRNTYAMEKDHYMDAVAIAAACLDKEPKAPELPHVYEIKQYRRHNRAYVDNQRERTYKVDGKIVAKNRKPREEQPKDCPAWSQYLTKLDKEAYHHAIHHVTVEKSVRHYATRLDKPFQFPGAVVLMDGKRHVIQGMQNNKTRANLIGCDKSVSIRTLTVIRQGGGLVYL